MIVLDLMAGYSGAPLVKKLGIKPESALCVLNEPPNYRKLLAPLPSGVELFRSLSPGADLVHIFSTSRAELRLVLRKSLATLRADAAVWILWPKKASKVQTDITEDSIRALALPFGLVDIKVCAIDEIWSGLKLVVRKERRAGWI